VALRVASTGTRIAARSVQAAQRSRCSAAVLGGGIDRDYPAVHAALTAEIAERLVLVSEYEPRVGPALWHFPARNRVIAGLFATTVVVKAREKEPCPDHRSPLT
jgi:DNA processing protein